MKKQNRGITLVALVITIIILLILSGLTISALTGSGLFGKAGEAVDKYGSAQNRENLELSKYEDYINGYINGTRGTITIDEDSYNALISKINLLENNYNTLSKEMEKISASKAEIETGTYIGTGTYGSANKNSITFSKAPKLVYLAPKDGYYYDGNQATSTIFIAGGASISGGMAYSYLNISENGVCNPIVVNWANDNKEMYWYSNINQYHQLNSKDTEYTWVAFYD